MVNGTWDGQETVCKGNKILTVNNSARGIIITKLRADKCNPYGEMDSLQPFRKRRKGIQMLHHVARKKKIMDRTHGQ